MKKYISFLVSIIITLFCFNSFAFTPPAKPDNGWYVLDQAGKLSTDEVSNLNHKIDNLNKTTKNEYAIVILNTLDGTSIEEAAQDTFRAWGVGKKDLNNGVMIMLSVGERKSRIQTGKGVEGDLPDLRCRDILDSTLKPHLKKGHFYNGLDATVDEISKYLESRANTPAVVSTNNDVDSSGIIILLVCIGGIGLVMLIGYFLSRPKKNEYNPPLDYDYIPPPPKPIAIPIGYAVLQKTQSTKPKSSSTSTKKSSSSSPSYSSSSYDSASYSSSSYDSGGSFGGGDSGGGGASSGW